MSDAEIPLPHPATGELFGSPVAPGVGWPGDVARPDTPEAATAHEVVELAERAGSLAELDALVSVCRACPRLVEWREHVAVNKRAAFAAEPYWGRPVPGRGSATATGLIVGLAPAAHGGNRTGRIFTGDRSGDWLFASLYRVGLVNQPASEHAADGLELHGIRITAPVHCAPPANQPTTEEKATCSAWLDRELAFLEDSVQAIVALGGIAWTETVKAVRRRGWQVPKPSPKFGHGVEAELSTPQARKVRLIGCYHVSQQNTFTGKLTEAMLDDVMARLGP